MESHVPEKVRRAGAPAHDTRRFSRARARANATHMGRSEHAGEITTPEHLHMMLHATSLCTTPHRSAQQISSTAATNNTHRQHAARKHTTHHAHTHAHPVGGSPTEPTAAAAANKHHTAEIMQHAAASSSSRRSASHEHAQLNRGSAAFSSAPESQTDTSATSFAQARQLISVSSAAMAATQFMPAAMHATPSPRTRPHARVATLPPCTRHAL